MRGRRVGRVKEMRERGREEENAGFPLKKKGMQFYEVLINWNSE